MSDQPEKQLPSPTFGNHRTAYAVPLTSQAAPTWWLILLLFIALAAQAERIATVRSATGETPFHSANDRSRWCSVAALGNYGRFEIDDIIANRDPQTKRKVWNTIDMVRHRGRDGKQHYYSSKPPLLSAMHASVYAAVRLATGLNILTYPFTAARIVLFLVNWLPLAICWWLWSRYWQPQPMTFWSLTMILLLTCWGTFVSTFANTLNNHLPGALSAGVSLWALLRIIESNEATTARFVLACAAAAMCAVCELPALAWTAAVCLLLVQIDWRKTVTGVVVGMLPLAIGFAVLNIWAHGDLRPPYAHRAVGELVASIAPSTAQPSDASSNSQLVRMQEERGLLLQAVRNKGFKVSDTASIQATRTAGVIELWDEATQVRFALVKGDGQIHIHHWDDWYDYPNSYWYPDRKQGVDRGEPSRTMYIMHTTIGHHGLFSLTPMWLFVPLGAWSVWSSSRGTYTTTILRLMSLRVQLMLAIVGTSLVCYAFYMARPLEDRNYGGVSCGFRWMHWFAPLWCWLVGQALMAIDSRSQLQRRTWTVWHGLAMLALAISIASACIPWGNPWTSPWLTRFI